jgi:hypothetical protein
LNKTLRKSVNLENIFQVHALLLSNQAISSPDLHNVQLLVPNLSSTYLSSSFGGIAHDSNITPRPASAARIQPHLKRAAALRVRCARC